MMVKDAVWYFSSDVRKSNTSNFQVRLITKLVRCMWGESLSRQLILMLLAMILYPQCTDVFKVTRKTRKLDALMTVQ